MLSKLCIYNNKVFFVLDYFLVAFSYQKFTESEKEKFSETLKIKLPVKFISVVDTKLDVINNYFTGLKSLLISLYDTNGHLILFIYDDSFRKKLHKIILPNLSIGIKDAFFISDGPTFLSHSKNTFYIYPLPYCRNKYSDFKFPFSAYKEYKFLQFKCFGPFESSYQPCLYILIISCSSSCQQTLKILGFLSDTKNPITNVHELPVNVFFPLYYETVLKAIEITKANPYLKTDSLKIENMEWKETESVICTENECLIFSNADLQYYCKLPLPLTNVIRMQTDFMTIFSGDIHLVLTFENEFVFFIEIKQNLNSMVVKQWTDIEATVIGDILMKGSKQVLLLKQQTDVSSWQNNMILYDMSSFMPIESWYQSSVPDNCLKATISGLEKKVKIGKVAIRDIEFEISQKSAATIDALIKLNECKMTAENIKSSRAFQQSLVDLILSNDENKVETFLSVPEPSVKLLEEKHQFLNNKLIISLSFVNEGERCICYPSVKILKQNAQLTCIQKLFVCKSDDSFFPSEYVRGIISRAKFYILLVLENVVFQTDDDIFMILTWYNGSTDEFDNEIFTKEDKKVLSQSQIYIQTRITLSDILKQDTSKGIASSSDLLFIQALQQRTNLCISSLHSDISKLEDILLQNDSKSKHLHLFETSSSKCVVFNSNISPLFGVHFFIMNSESNVVEIGAFSRNGGELCLLVYYLYEHLPKDVMISPCLKFKEETAELKKNLALCMKNELDLLISSFNAHNISEEMKKNYVKSVSSQTVETLTIPKIDYQRIRTVLVKKECITDNMIKFLNQNVNFSR